jgi:hypothetical protein
MITADVAHLRLRPSRQTARSSFAIRPDGPLGLARLVRRATFPSVASRAGELEPVDHQPTGCKFVVGRCLARRFVSVKTGGSEPPVFTPVVCPASSVCKRLCAAPPVGGALE